MVALRELGTVIWLRGPLEEVLARARRAGNRPMLEGRSPDEIAALYREREAYYAQAHITVDTAGLGIDEHVARFEADHDDYNAILLKALADRLAETLAERMHQRVRTEFWGYAADEALDNEALIAERYRGIRPAPGYPACPEHSEKATLWKLLDVEKNTGITLTESYAMWPGAAVSGWYYSHPQSQYFVLGRITREQVASYAERKGWTLAQAEKWLSPNLGYEPED